MKAKTSTDSKAVHPSAPRLGRLPSDPTAANRRQRFRILDFANPSGTRSFRVQGMNRQSRYIRENYTDWNAADLRRIELETEFLTRQPCESAVRATSLTEAQVRLAESAFLRLDADDELPLAVAYWLEHGRNKAVVESPRLDAALTIMSPTPSELATIAATLDKTGTGDLATLARRALDLYCQCALTIEQARSKPCQPPPPDQEPDELNPSEFPVPFGEFLKMALPKASVPDREKAYRDWMRHSLRLDRAEKKCNRFSKENKPCDAHAIHAAEPLPGIADAEVMTAIAKHREHGFDDPHYSTMLSLFRRWLENRRQTEQKAQRSAAAKARWSHKRIAEGNRKRLRKAIDIPAGD